MENTTEIRQQLIANCHQIVIKAGTRLLTDRSRIARLVDGIAEVRRRGCRVLLVSSGAVGMGMQQLGLSRRPRELAAVQALASVGQCKLMAFYEEECARHGFKVAQLLLTAADLRSRTRYLNVMNCINALWENDVLPIVNENDAVSVDELKFGDNDYLAGLLASLTGSRLTVILTTAQGLCKRENGILGDRISVVPRVDASIRAMAGGTDSSEFSIGGMTSKLRAAELVNASGEYLWIADGREDGMLRRIMDGEDVGTVFLPGPERLPGHKRFIRFFAGSNGAVTVDAGAADALIRRGGSLLPSGVTGVTGSFGRGDTVDILCNGKLIARGLVNHTAADCQRIKGLHSEELEAALGHTADEEIIHRDNLTLL